METLFPAERQQHILEFLQKEVAIRGSRLSELLNVSDMTIRRDLDAMEKQGLIERTHGGAILKQERVYRKFQYKTSAQENIDEKEKIAQAAAALIEPNDTVYIGEGTTTCYITKYVDPQMPFTIFSNNLGLLSQDVDIAGDIIVLGGKYDRITNSISGPLTLELMNQFTANKVFLGTDGLTLSDGVTSTNLDLAYNAKTMIKNTRGQVIIVMDSNKFGKIAETMITPLKEIDVLVTDREIPPDFKNDLEAYNIQMVIASEKINVN